MVAVLAVVEIYTNLIQPWYIALIIAVIGGIITGLLAFLGVFYSIRYYKKKDEEQVRLEVTSKGGVLVDMFYMLKTHYLYAEKLRLGLEIDKYYLTMKGIEKVGVDKYIGDSSNFLLYKDAKERTEDIKLQLASSLEQFWTAVNKAIIAFPNKGNSYKEAQTVGKAIVAFNDKALVSFNFDNTLEIDSKERPIQKEPSDWANEEHKKMVSLIKEDGNNLGEMITDINKKITNLSDSLWPKKRS